MVFLETLAVARAVRRPDEPPIAAGHLHATALAAVHAYDAPDAPT
jgi:hypothetical protein